MYELDKMVAEGYRLGIGWCVKDVLPANLWLFLTVGWPKKGQSLPGSVRPPNARHQEYRK